MDRIRLVIIDDSPLTLEIFSKILATAQDIEVVGKFTDGFELLRQVQNLKPDLICTDYFMPKIDGLELTKRLMEIQPYRILVVSSVLDVKRSKAVFPFFEAGALDCIEKPTKSDTPLNEGARQFISKIRALAKVPLWLKHKKIEPNAATKSPATKPPSGGTYYVVVIGASAGGPTALMKIFSILPENFPVPILCVQHISEGFLPSLIEYFTEHSRLKMAIMKDHEPLKPGTVYFPQEKSHMSINSHNELVLAHQPPVNGHKPCIDITMNSVVAHYGANTIGILLSGMGKDGAAGLSAINAAGGLTIAQSEQTCVIYGMPKEALALRAVKVVLDIEEIGPYLLKLFSLSAPEQKL